MPAWGLEQNLFEGKPQTFELPYVMCYHMHSSLTFPHVIQ